MYDDEDRPRYRYRSGSRDYDHGRGANYRRSSRSPRGDREEGEYDYYRSRKDDDDVDDGHARRRSPGYHHPHHHSRPQYDASLSYDDEQAEHHDPDHAPPARSYAPPPARPSSTIIVEGLPDDATDDDILDGFASVSPDSKVFHADRVRAIRLRNNKRGRRIGFVEFVDVNAAADFLEYHYPGLRFQLAHSRGVNSEMISVGINYSWGREDEAVGRDDRSRDMEDWNCPECAFMNYGSRHQCHRCRANRPPAGSLDGHYRARDDIVSYGPKLTGETDECPQQIPSQYLVIRGFEPSVTEETFANGVKKLYVEANPEAKKGTQNKLKSTAPSVRSASLGAKPDSLRRVFLLRDKKTDEVMRYGFAEFATFEDAQAAIEKFKASPKFTISSKPVSVAFIHNGVFVPHTGRVTDENSRFVFNPIYNKDIFLKYWDNRVYPSILSVSGSVDQAKKQSSDNAGSPDKPDEAQDGSGKKLKRFKVGLPATTAKPAIAMGPQLQMWAKKRAELVGEAQAQAELAESTASSSAPSERERGSKRTGVKDSYLSYSDVDSLSCFLCMRTFASSQALRDHEVLNKDHIANLSREGKREAATEKLAAEGKRPQVVTLRVFDSLHTPAGRMYTSYADRESLHCLICERKFTKAAVLSLHERESEMHRQNLADQRNIDRAISQLARMGKTPRKMMPAKNKGLQYRDRARERRQAYNQPGAPRRKAPKEDTAPVKEPEKPAPSKGAALLGKMGWTAGEGLGADRAGRTDVIATDMYAAGVGLGAEGGKIGDAVEEAARKTKDNYSDFVEVTRSKARERFAHHDASLSIIPILQSGDYRHREEAWF
ncbi:hypothetical protein VMCG_08475 [Cytospora schulzeri]|uniref:RNA-binding protein n=1 Tax=Cytospora schulzeri TaxID=448051 RepID=A0A423VWJ8_9PEZI|nr:hypothetical protein VMCG_08475 [Valsa malicola]